MNIPKKLKDPKCYEDVERFLFIPSEHKHRKVAVWQKCKTCQEGFAERSRRIRELGFKNAQQYHEWKRIIGQMRIIEQLDEETATK